MAFRYRCRRCRMRRSFKRRPEHYVRTPVCACCGSTDWTLDRYRTFKEARRFTCTCGYLLPYPHRRGSKGCCEYPHYVTDSIVEELGAFTLPDSFEPQF